MISGNDLILVGVWFFSDRLRKRLEEEAFFGGQSASSEKHYFRFKPCEIDQE